MHDDTLSLLLREKIVVILRDVPAEKLLPVAHALIAGNLHAMEVTFSSDGSVPDEAVASQIKTLVTALGDRACVGAGTVLTEHQVDLALQAGAKFIVSPDTNADVIAKTRALGLVSMPGAITPTEAQQAHRCGADIIKLFPVNCLGAEYAKMLFTPLKHLRFFAVGKMSEEDIPAYLEAGVCGFAIGTNIVDSHGIAVNDYASITENAKRFVEKVTPCR